LDKVNAQDHCHEIIYDVIIRGKTEKRKNAYLYSIQKQVKNKQHPKIPFLFKKPHIAKEPKDQ